MRTIAERSDEILNDPAAPVGGNPAGDVTLVEFFDYNCPPLVDGSSEPGDPTSRYARSSGCVDLCEPALIRPQ